MVWGQSSGLGPEGEYIATIYEIPVAGSSDLRNHENAFLRHT